MLGSSRKLCYTLWGHSTHFEVQAECSARDADLLGELRGQHGCHPLLEAVWDVGEIPFQSPHLVQRAVSAEGFVGGGNVQGVLVAQLVQLIGGHKGPAIPILDLGLLIGSSSLSAQGGKTALAE